MASLQQSRDDSCMVISLLDCKGQRQLSASDTPWSPHRAAMRIYAVGTVNFYISSIRFSDSKAFSQMMLISQQLKMCTEALALAMYPFNF